MVQGMPGLHLQTGLSIVGCLCKPKSQASAEARCRQWGHKIFKTKISMGAINASCGF